ncbi:hypothetical protein [Arenimonas fontis]|uniref:Uncharacterized protein n=1 Tax=Arenimonas fontis TaxID=2608255 RepID=A0A5B2Z962_9GAMM|nr:hypothetical protein [Arenimonas fontis]KAA2283704.1 hypothetical protein F0415_12155 [Arenimonas fontis]
MASEKSRQVLDRIAASANEDQKQALVQWSDELLTIKQSNASLAKKVAASISATAKFSTLKPLFALIGKELTPRELSTLSEDLLSIYNSNSPRIAKLKQGVAMTGKALKELGWDNRGLPGRLGISTAIATVVIFGGQGAGIAALGTAIGVPLWVVFGAGAAFLGEIYERFSGKKRQGTTYTIEAKRKRDDA